MAGLKLDPSADVFFDLLSGGLVWTDEQLFVGLTVEQSGCLRAIFRYRTSLITGELDSRFEALWNSLKTQCPGWIGFDPTRCTTDKKLVELHDRLRQAS